MTETIVLGGGCFWCLDAAYRDLNGVVRVTSGYAGGHTPRPTYEQVCGKRTGHAEVIEVEFEPNTIALDDLLRMFFTLHDPTTKDRQGADVGPQYRSVALYRDAEQRAVVERILAEIDASGVWGAKAVTELAPLGDFWPAEPEHQDYFARNPYSGYCRAVVAPKVSKFRKSFADRLKRPAA